MQTLEKKNVNLILKIAFQGGFAFDTLSACNVYEKEADFYDIIAPEIRQLLRNVNETEQLLPETIYINKANHAMIFDDLVSKGYRLMPLQPGFNKLEAQMILSKMASYHAAGAVLKVQKPKIFEKEMYYTRGNINIKSLYTLEILKISRFTIYRPYQPVWKLQKQLFSHPIKCAS